MFCLTVGVTILHKVRNKYIWWSLKTQGIGKREEGRPLHRKGQAAERRE